MSQQVSLPMTNIAGFCFNLAALVAIDLTGYTEKAETRNVIVYLAHTVSHVFHGERADALMDWYLELTGERKVQPVRHGLGPSLNFR